MPNNSIQELETFFEKQLERTNSWLSFAEAKNAALIAFNIAIIAFLADFQKAYPLLSTIAMLFFIISCMICLYSFLPQTPNRPQKFKNAKDPDNLVFWKDIAYVENEDKYIEFVTARYFPSITLKEYNNKLCIDLASEIVINSRIALTKYNCFTTALRIDFLAFLLSIALLIVA